MRRRPTDGKGPQQNDGHWMRAAAFTLCAVWWFLYAAAFFRGVMPWRCFGSGEPRLLSDALVLVGGPVTLFFCSLFALKWEQGAGGLLWMGAASVAMGLSLAAEHFVGRYFLGLLCLVIPQAFAASLFLAHARRANRTAALSAARRRRT